jgi:ribosomal protein L37E
MAFQRNDMYCNQCGATVESNAKFCSKCGAAISSNTPKTSWNVAPEKAEVKQTTGSEPLNYGLWRVHRVLFIAYTSLGVIGALAFVLMLVRNNTHPDVISFVIQLVVVAVLPLLVVSPLAALHWYAAKKVRLGTPGGRTLSRIIATIFLFGVPIGTIVGAYMLSRLGKEWQSDVLPEKSTA